MPHIYGDIGTYIALLIDTNILGKSLIVNLIIKILYHNNPNTGKVIYPRIFLLHYLYRTSGSIIVYYHRVLDGLLQALKSLKTNTDNMLVMGENHNSKLRSQ